MKLNDLTKAGLVELVENLQKENNALSAAPLTSTAVEKMNLSLVKDIATIKDKAEARKENHLEKLADMAAEHSKAVKELELKYSAGEGLDATDLEETYTRLEARAEKTKENITFGVKQAELESIEKLEEMEAVIVKAEEEVIERVGAANTKALEAEANAKAKIDKFKLVNDRELEDQEYKHTIALRDKDLEAAELIAQEAGKILVLEANWNELTTSREEEIKEHKGEISKIASASFEKGKIAVTDEVKEELIELKGEVALLKNDKKYLTEGNLALIAQNLSLTEQVKSIPQQIADAVASAKVDVSVDNGKSK